MSKRVITGTVHESGSGIPGIGEYVIEVKSGDLYRILDFTSRICTIGPNWTRRAVVGLVDWSDFHGEPSARVTLDGAR